MIDRYPFRVDLLSPLAIGTGEPTLIADDSVTRRHDGLPMIPSTSLKGAIRDLIRTSSLPPELWHQAFGQPDGATSSVIITDAVATPEATTNLITTVALDERRVARIGALATIEVVDTSPDPSRPVAFHGQVLASPTAPPELARRAVGLTLLGLSAIRSLGSRTRRGWGQVRVALAPPSAALAREYIEEFSR